MPIGPGSPPFFPNLPLGSSQLLMGTSQAPQVCMAWIWMLKRQDWEFPNS